MINITNVHLRETNKELMYNPKIKRPFTMLVGIFHLLNPSVSEMLLNCNFVIMIVILFIYICLYVVHVQGNLEH
jgi:hypothetical protein